MSSRIPRRLTGAAVMIVVVVAAVVITFVLVGGDDGADNEQQQPARLGTATVEQRDLTEYLEISGTLDYQGTVSLTTRNNGVLMQLADEGTVLRQGDRVYLIVHEASAEDNARVLAAVASARDALSVATDRLNDAVAGPSASDVAAARVAVAEATEARSELTEPASDADIRSAEAELAAATEDLETLRDPTAGELAVARADVATAEARLADLLTPPTEAELEAARAAVQTAEQALAVLQAGPTEAEIETARAARLAAWEHLRDELQRADNDVAIELARAELLAAEENLADVRAGPTDAEINDAKARVLSAEEALAVLRAGPTDAEINDAEAQVLAATERLNVLENPTQAQVAQALARLDTAAEAVAELRSGPTSTEIDAAHAAVLAAEDALADLLAEVSPAELASLEAALASAEAELVSAQADVTDLAETHRALYLMYGTTPAYRTMAVGLEGDDVRQLEQNLADIGFGDAEGFEVDGVFDEHTADAVRLWQMATEQHVDGMVDTTDVLFAAGPLQVGALEQGIEVGQSLEIGRTLASLTVIETPEADRMATTQRVVADLPLGDRDLVSVGIAVNVELPDGADIAGTITDISSSPVLDTQTGENAVEVTIVLDEPASPVWIGATVNVEITETLIADALVVPATALLALVEGGHAVEVLNTDGSTHLVGVETGLFVDGDVEVMSDQIAAGMRVVVPR